MTAKTPLEFWTRQKKYCQNLLIEAKTQIEVEALNQEIMNASEQLEAINNGTYEAPKLCFEVWIMQPCHDC